MHKQAGFNLIELMYAIGIIGLLAAIAMPMYRDYTIRAKVSEGLQLIAASKTSVSEYYSFMRKMPGNNAQAGLPPQIASLYVTDIDVGVAGIITVRYDSVTSGVNPGDKIEFVPTPNESGVGWACNGPGTTMPTKWLPQNCR